MVRLIVLALVLCLVTTAAVTGSVVLMQRFLSPEDAIPTGSASDVDPELEVAELRQVVEAAERDDADPSEDADTAAEDNASGSPDPAVRAAAEAPIASASPTTVEAGAAPTPAAPTSIDSPAVDATPADTPAAMLAEGRLGKIFGSMQPKEAARVLEQMADADVVTILAMLNDRQAAAVLANLPPQRAAQISRLGFQVGRSER
jgi:hypothetical protein